MKKLLLPMLLTAMAAVSFNTYAVDESEADSIKAECQEESKDAQYPEEYAAECIQERLQVLQEEQGGSEKESSERG